MNFWSLNSHIKGIILSVLVAFQFGNSTSAYSEVPITVMTYNILKHSSEDKKYGDFNSWKLPDSRKDALIDVIAGADPDVLVLQEMRPDNCCSSIRDFDEDPRLIGKYERVYHIRDWITDHKYKARLTNAIYYKNDKFERLNHLEPVANQTFWLSPSHAEQGSYPLGYEGRFWISETPEVPWSRPPGFETHLTQPNGTGAARMVLWAKLRHLDTGYIFYVFNVHGFGEFDNNRGWPQESKFETELLINEIYKITKYKFPVIIAGDFNASRNKNVYKILTQTQQQTGNLTITMPSQEIINKFNLNQSELGSPRAFKFPPKYKPFKNAACEGNSTLCQAGSTTVNSGRIHTIDYIFISDGLTATDASFLGDQISTRANYDWYPSDHKAVYATILLNNKKDDRDNSWKILPILEDSLQPDS